MDDKIKEKVLPFIEHNYGKILELEYIGSGFFSKAYLVSFLDKRKVLKISNNDADFKKDDFAHRFFNSHDIPVPKVEHIKILDKNTCIAVVELCFGKTYDDLNHKEKENLLPGVFSTLSSIHGVTVKKYKGFGSVDINFNGQHSSWNEWLHDRRNHKVEYNWSTIAARSFFDRKLYNELEEALERLSIYTPEEKYLVHGDFGFDNLLVDNITITGVIDWAESKLGDFLFDVAWLDFWEDEINFSDVYYDMYKKSNFNVTRYRERINCYLVNIGLSSLAFAAHREDEKDWDYTVSRLNTLL